MDGLDRGQQIAAGIIVLLLLAGGAWLALGQPGLGPDAAPPGEGPSTGTVPEDDAGTDGDEGDSDELPSEQDGTETPPEDASEVDPAGEQDSGEDGDSAQGDDSEDDGPPPEEPEPADYTLEQVVDGLDQPLQYTHAGDGSGRTFAVEQTGRVRVVEDGEVSATPFLDLREAVNASGSEQGLLSIAFHPDFADNGRAFVNYTRGDGSTVVAGYTVSEDNPDRIDPESRQVILTVEQPYRNHNGGLMRFGPDGYLYIGLGDGGSGGDPHGHGQNIETLLGSLLRLDVDEPAADRAYGIPQDNPFVDQEGRDEIWAYGLRNPWRFSFDSGTGDLYLADVGQNNIEEINLEPAGSPGGVNYGWNVYEGSERYSGGEPRDRPVFPIAEYAHGSDHCSVTGGHVYRGDRLPALEGSYFYGDWCSGQIWRLRQGDDGFQSLPFMDTDLRITAFGRDGGGELYVVDQGGGVYRLARREQQ